MAVLVTRRRWLEKEVAKSEKDAQAFVECVYRRDPLSVVTKVHAVHSFDQCAQRTQQIFEIVWDYVDAQVAKFKLHCKDIAFPKHLLALQIFNAAHVEDSQRVSILAACVNNIKAGKDIGTFTKKLCVQ